MDNRSVALSFRAQLLTGVAAVALIGFALAPQEAKAADVVCAPDASGTPITNAAETCTGPGDKIDYATIAPTVSSTVTLSGVTINAAATDGVGIAASVLGPNQTILSSGVGSITATLGNGINMTAAALSAGTLSVGTSTSRFNNAITGGTNAGTQGIFIQSRGDVNVFTGNAAAITSNAAAGGSWGIRAQAITAGASAGGAVIIDTQGAISAVRGGILATSAGTDATDSVTVITSGTVTGLAGSAIEARSINADTTVTAGAAVIGSVGVGAGGGIVATVTGTGNVFVTTLAGAPVTGNGSNGINTTAIGGNTTIIVANSVAGTGTGASNGIKATSTTGNIAVTANGSAINGVALDAANTGSGIGATTTTGAITLTTTGAGSIGNFAGTTLDFGLNATSTSGVIVVNNTSLIGNAATAGNGVDVAGISALTASAATTAISVTNSGALHVDNVTGFSNITNAGIYADNGAGTGAVTVTNSGLIDPPDFGIYANSAGNVSVSNSGVVSGDTGIHASTTGTTSTLTVLVTGGSVTGLGNAGAGTGGNGIEAFGLTTTGLVTVGTSANRIGAAVTGGNGALAANGIQATGAGDVSVFAGNVAISTTSTAGATWAIRAQSLPAVTSGPGGAVIVDTQGAITATRGAIQARATGTDSTDSVTVITTGAVTGNAGAGIQVQSVNGNSTVTASGNVLGSTGTGTHGISLAVTGTGTATITTLAGATVTGTGTGVDAINAATTSGSLTVNTSAGGAVTGARNAITTIVTTGATTITSGSATGTAGSGISTSATSGATTININGAVRGLGGATTAAVNMVSTGGAIVLNNNASGIISSIGGLTTDFAIKAGTGPVTINNAGLITGKIDVSTASSSTLNNSGTIMLANNAANDVLNLGSTTYVSSGAANIHLDAFLGAGTQNACASPTVADCVIFGASSGTGTTITIEDTNAANPGALNPTGIVLVHVASGAASNFTLTGNNVVNTGHGPAIEKGFVEYQLAFDAPNSNFVLVTAPGTATVEMGSVMAGMQNLWHMTAQGSDDRVEAIRQTYAANLNGTPIPAAANSVNGTSVWGKLAYGEFRRDTSLSVSGLTSDTSYNQTMEGIEVGVDQMVRKDADGTWVLGALAGYNTSRLNFRADANKVRYTTWNFGAYASYMSGPWFGDLLVKDDLTRVKFDFPGVAGLEKRDGNSFGGKLTIGGRFAQEGIDLQPMASLAYVRSSLSDVVVPGSSFDFDSGSSFRGTLGMRVSTTMNQGMTALQPFLFAGIGDEFDAKNSVTLTSGASSVAIDDKPIHGYGIASIGLNIFGADGVSGFVKADGMFASHAKSFAFWAGLRFTP